MGVSKGLKEWSAVVEAIGNGEQTVLVRSYEPPAEFFLYPTFSYYSTEINNQERFQSKFQKSAWSFAWNCGKRTTERAKEDMLVDIEYFVRADETLRLTASSNWKGIASEFIWSVEHVQNYASRTRDGVVYLWIVRAFRLREPVVIGRIAQGGPPHFYQHSAEIDVTGAVPILMEEKYSERKRGIIEKCKLAKV